MFASQSEGYTNSDPVGLSFGPAGPGPYTPGVGFPQFAGWPTPSIYAPSGGNPFAGAGWTSNFIDMTGPNYTAAKSVINDSVASLPTQTADINITIPYWQLYQATGALPGMPTSS